MLDQNTGFNVPVLQLQQHLCVEHSSTLAPVSLRPSSHKAQSAVIGHLVLSCD